MSENITGIGDYALLKCSNLKTINLPRSLKYVGKRAFYNCYNLNLDKMPDCEIGTDAFSKEEYKE